jgi:hypothetical protein
MDPMRAADPSSHAASDRRKQLAAAILGGLGVLFAALNLDEVRVNWILGTWSTPLSSSSSCRSCSAPVAGSCSRAAAPGAARPSDAGARYGKVDASARSTGGGAQRAGHRARCPMLLRVGRDVGRRAVTGDEPHGGEGRSSAGNSERIPEYPTAGARSAMPSAR